MRLHVMPRIWTKLRLCLGAVLVVSALALLIDWAWSYSTLRTLYIHTRPFTGGRRHPLDPYFSYLNTTLWDVRGHFVIRYEKPLFAVPGPMSAPVSGIPLWTFCMSPCDFNHLYSTAEARQPHRRLTNGFGFWFESEHVATSKPSENYERYVVAVPHWFLALLFVVSSRMLLRRPWINYRCRRRGLCVQCGYDLRATPDRCPECGLVPGNGKRVRDQWP
jgi:hypothetical protein